MEALSSSPNEILTQPRLLQCGGDWNRPFRLMLVHDGIQCVHRAIDNLQSLDLPRKTEVLLLSISELFRTPLHLAGRSDVPSAFVRVNPGAILPKYKKTQAFFDHLEFVTRQAQARLHAAFPHWEIRFERPLAWQPDLVYFCPFDPSSVSELGLIELIRKMSEESNIPLIVGRRQADRAAGQRFLVVVFDGGASAGAVSKELARWPIDQESELYLILFKDRLMSAAERWMSGYQEADCEWLDSELDKTRKAIEALGHRVSCMNVVGNTAHAILQEANRVEARNILLAIGDSAGMQTIAATVAAQAGCTVKIVFSGERPTPPKAARSAAGRQHAARWKSTSESRSSLSAAI